MAAGVSVINWLSVIWRGKGKGQYVLSAGVLLTVSWIRVTVMEPRRTSFVWKSEISLSLVSWQKSGQGYGGHWVRREIPHIVL